MPTRYLKPGIRDSEAIDSLSPMSEVLFYRLLVTVDDFGRYDGRPKMVKAACFPIRESVTAKTVDKSLEELSKQGLITVYESDNKPYLQMNKWDNKPRASSSKYPEHDTECIQLYTDVRNPRTCVPLTKTKTKTKTETKTETETSSNHFDGFWSAYPKKVGKQQARKAWDKIKNINAESRAIMEALSWQTKSKSWTKDQGQFIPNPATYLNQRRWEDEPSVSVETDEQRRQREIDDWINESSGSVIEGKFEREL